MLKAGLLPSPTINALSSNVSASKNKIDTQTFVELRSGSFRRPSPAFFVHAIDWCCFFSPSIRGSQCEDLLQCRWNETRSLSNLSYGSCFHVSLSRCISSGTRPTCCQRNCCDKVSEFTRFEWPLFCFFFSSDGLRESNIMTKYFDVNDMYADNYPEYLDDYSDPEQSFDRLELVGLLCLARP